MVLANGTPEQKAMAQSALDRWWWPSIAMFGPPDDDSPHSAQSMAWKIKRFSNDQLRQKFIDMAVVQAQALGLDIPDPDLKFNEKTGHWETGPIDWDEFWSVVKGKGPCNRQRMAHRRKAHDDGAWVREAAMTFASKQKQKSQKAAA